MRAGRNVGGSRTSLPNEALLPTALGRETAGSLRSQAVIMIERRGRAPQR